MPPRSRRALKVPPTAAAGFERVESIKMLGITISRRFSVAEHVDNLLATCAQTLFALRTVSLFIVKSVMDPTSIFLLFDITA